MRDLYNDPKFLLAREWFKDACLESQKHGKMLRHALDVFGDYGPNVSGVGKNHFPDETKQRLRDVARNVLFYSSMAWESKPKGVHDSTMRKLSRQCANKHGFGFYGPQGDIN